MISQSHEINQLIKAWGLNPDNLSFHCLKTNEQLNYQAWLISRPIEKNTQLSLGRKGYISKNLSYLLFRPLKKISSSALIFQKKSVQLQSAWPVLRWGAFDQFTEDKNLIEEVIKYFESLKNYCDQQKNYFDIKDFLANFSSFYEQSLYAAAACCLEHYYSSSESESIQKIKEEKFDNRLTKNKILNPRETYKLKWPEEIVDSHESLTKEIEKFQYFLTHNSSAKILRIDSNQRFTSTDYFVQAYHKIVDCINSTSPLSSIESWESPFDFGKEDRKLPKEYVSFLCADETSLYSFLKKSKETEHDLEIEQFCIKWGFLWPKAMMSYMDDYYLKNSSMRFIWSSAYLWPKEEESLEKQYQISVSADSIAGLSTSSFFSTVPGPE